MTAPLPTCPLPSLPQQYSLPTERIAHVWLPPAETVVQSVARLALAGDAPTKLVAATTKQPATTILRNMVSPTLLPETLRSI